MHADMDMRNTTLVIGAGPAGLAAAGELRRAGVRAVVLGGRTRSARRGAAATTGCD